MIVVNDGSPNKEHTKYLESLIKSYRDKRIKYFFKQNGGLSDARNFGTDNCKGEYLAFIDQDDMWKPEKLQKQIDAIQNEKAEIVITNCEIFGEENCIKDFSIVNNGKGGFIPDSYQKMLKYNFVDSISIVFSRRVVEKAGYSNRKYFVAPDYEYFVRMSKVENFYLIKEPLTLYRLHENNTVKQENRMFTEIISILFESNPKGFTEKKNATIQITKTLIKLAINWIKLLLK